MNEICILSNWKIDHEGALKSVITISTNTIDSPIDNIKAENCKCLRKEDNELNSKPEIKITLRNSIKQIDIFSEGYLVEVFGDTDEYLFTRTGSFVDDWQEMAVYHTQIPLPKLHKCNLKFSRIKNEDRLWIYNIHFTIDNTTLNNHTLFNMDNVKHLLHDSYHQAPERAEKFTEFLKTCILPRQQPINQMEKLFKTLSVENDKIMRGQLNTKENKFEEEKNLEVPEWDQDSIKCFIAKQVSNAKAEIISHVDNKIDELEKRLSNKFEKIIGNLCNH